MSQVMNVSIPIVLNGTLAPGTTSYFAFFAPTAAGGGGITVTKFNATSSAAAGAGSAPQVDLLSTGSTGAVNGTVASTGSVAWTAGTPATGTISSAFVDATYGLAIRWKQVAANADTHNVTASVQYVMGR